MKETIAIILAWLFLFAILFVFQGTPDLWDKWHDMAMGAACSGARQ